MGCFGACEYAATGGALCIRLCTVPVPCISRACASYQHAGGGWREGARWPAPHLLIEMCIRALLSRCPCHQKHYPPWACCIWLRRPGALVNLTGDTTTLSAAQPAVEQLLSALPSVSGRLTPWAPLALQLPDPLVSCDPSTALLSKQSCTAPAPFLIPRFPELLARPRPALGLLAICK